MQQSSSPSQACFFFLFYFFFSEIAKYILQQIKCDSRGILYEHAVDVAYETSFVRIL